MVKTRFAVARLYSDIVRTPAAASRFRLGLNASASTGQENWPAIVRSSRAGPAGREPWPEFTHERCMAVVVPRPRAARRAEFPGPAREVR